MSNEPPRWTRLASWREDIPLAAAFLARTPWSAASIPASPQALAAASWTFPLIGALIGLAGGVLNLIALRIGLSPLVAGLIAVGTTILITGAGFERGLAGTAEAAGTNILGVCGTLALIFSVALRAVALGDVDGAGHVMAALIAAHGFTRGFMPLSLHLFGPPALDQPATDVTIEGTEAAVTEPAGLEAPSSATAWTSAGLGVLIVLLFLDLGPGLLALILAAVGMVATAIFMRNRTRARFGAPEAVGEIIVLLVASLWL